jgi:hypothetical protein
MDISSFEFVCCRHACSDYEWAHSILSSGMVDSMRCVGTLEYYISMRMIRYVY